VFILEQGVYDAGSGFQEPVGRMEVLFKQVAGFVALGVEAAAVVIIAFGAGEALARTIRVFFKGGSRTGLRKEVWLRFGVWLLLGLEFELAADIVRTAISPSWNDIGQLASIGAIRTFLNYFLEADLDKYGEAARVKPVVAA
jgi:uncharacterized membrane protein